jgi:xylose isomerase
MEYSREATTPARSASWVEPSGAQPCWCGSATRRDFGTPHSFIIWPGSEGYNYPFQRAYAETWARFLDGIAEIAQHARERDVKVFLEHKNSEPAMKILMRNIGMTLFVIHEVRDRGVDTDHILVNMDWQHLLMNGESLGEYSDLLAAHGKLGHQHANDGWGSFDDDNVVGTNFFMQTLELAVVLQDVDYGEG